MRLIDAEKCPCNGCGVMYCYKNCKEYEEWFNGCDYDVEAKVAELEALRAEKVEMIGGYCQNTISKAISIVRGKE